MSTCHLLSYTMLSRNASSDRTYQVIAISGIISILLVSISFSLTCIVVGLQSKHQMTKTANNDSLPITNATLPPLLLLPTQPLNIALVKNDTNNALYNNSSPSDDRLQRKTRSNGDDKVFTNNCLLDPKVMPLVPKQPWSAAYIQLYNSDYALGLLRRMGWLLDLKTDQKDVITRFQRILLEQGATYTCAFPDDQKDETGVYYFLLALYKNTGQTV